MPKLRQCCLSELFNILRLEFRKSPVNCQCCRRTSSVTQGVSWLPIHRCASFASVARHCCTSLLPKHFESRSGCLHWRCGRVCAGTGTTRPTDRIFSCFHSFAFSWSSWFLSISANERCRSITKARKLNELWWSRVNFLGDEKITNTLWITRNGWSRSNSRELWQQILWRHADRRTEEKILNRRARR